MKTPSKLLGWVALGIAVPLFTLFMGWLMYWVFYGGARPAVDAYVADVRARKVVLADQESREAEAAIVRSKDVTIKNLSTRSTTSTGHGCYWGRLAMPSGADVDIVFVVTMNEGVWKVTRSTTKRKCRCPKGKDCTLYE